MKAGDHTLAITNKPLRLALFKRPDGSHDRPIAFAPAGATKRFHQCPCSSQHHICENAGYYSVTVSGRSISPHRVNTKPGDQSRLMGEDALPD
eukprot:1941202-Amphidinium_carterae.1